MKKFIAVFIARNMEFFRDKATFIWNIAFPVFLIFGFAFAFSGKNTVNYKIGFIGEIDNGVEFTSYKFMQFIPYSSKEVAIKKLTHHQIDMIIDFKNKDYYINSEAPNGYLLEKILLSDKGNSLNKKTVSGKLVRYIDWFIPGVLGMNIMFACLFGVGIVIVRYRNNGVLKRFKATPLGPIEFILAQMFSRFFIVIFMSTVIYVGTDIFLHFQMNGSYFDLIIVTIVAIFCMISLGLLFSTRLKSEEVVSGLLNLVVWPMMVLSGIWFSLEGTPKIMQDLSKIFPITHYVDAARKIMIDGAGLADVMTNLIVMVFMTILFIILSAFLFKWE